MADTQRQPQAATADYAQFSIMWSSEADFAEMQEVRGKAGFVQM